jgi:carboxypeptidase D
MQDMRYLNTNPRLYVYYRASYYWLVYPTEISQAKVMFREFILGNNKTGLLIDSNSTAVGGENPSLLLGPNNIYPGRKGILYGSGTATSLYTAPSATIASWEAFFASKVAVNATSTAISRQDATSASQSITCGHTTWGMGAWCALILVMISMTA